MDTSEDKAAPAPSATNKAGSAQHTKVLEVAKRLAQDDQKPFLNVLVLTVLIFE
jgi:hypothetical protein